MKIHRFATAVPAILAGDDRKGGLAQADLCVVGRDPEIAGQGQLAAAAGGRAAQRGDRRERERGDAAADRGQPRHELADLIEGHSAPLFEIGARAEMAPRRAHDETARPGVLAQLRDRRAELFDQLTSQRVDRRLVDREDSDPLPVGRDADDRPAHSSPFGRSGPAIPTWGGT